MEETEDTEDTDESEPILTGNLSKLFAASISDSQLSGTMVKVVASLKAAYFNLEQVTNLLTEKTKLSDFNDIIRTLDSSFEPILASVNETRNLLSDAVTNVPHAVKSLIYFQITNASEDVIAKNVADVTAAVGQFIKTVQSVIAAVVLTIGTAPKQVAESVSALIVILNTTIDIVFKIIIKTSANHPNLPAKVQEIYKIATESLSLAITATDTIISEITSVIINESSAGLIRNVDNILSALVPVTSNFVGNVNVITILVASYNINTLTLEIPRDISPIVSEFSVVFKRFFGSINTSIKALRKPARTLEVTTANMGACILKVIQFITSLRASEVVGSAIDSFSNSIKVRLENLVVILNKFAAALIDTPADRLNKTVAGMLQAVVKVTSFIVNHINDFHSDVVRVGGYVNLYVAVRDFLQTFTDFMVDIENDNPVLPEAKTIQ